MKIKLFLFGFGVLAAFSAHAASDDIIVAAYYYPGYHPFETGWPSEENSQFYPIGEWDKVRECKPRFEGHWQPRVPVWGYEDESDPRVMEKKIDAAVKYGVDCFIIDWYWYYNKPNRDGGLNEGFYNAKNNDKIDFYLMWANHKFGGDQEAYTWDSYRAIVDRVINTHFKHPSYLKIDGKPVFSIYDLNVFIESFGNAVEAAKAIEYFRNETKKAGFPGLHFQQVLHGIEANISGFDGNGRANEADVKLLKPDSLTHYHWIHISPPVADYTVLADKGVKAWADVTAEYDMPYFPHVSIAWDNHCRMADDGKIYPLTVDNVNPGVFKRYLEKAKAYVEEHPDQPRIVTINSWNEWVEASYLEPDERFGFGYLEAVRDVFGAD